MGQTPVVKLDLIIDHTNDQGDGTVTLSRVDGTVVSCQPDGSIQSRPDGTNGPYERAVLSNSFVIFCPDGVSTFEFPFASKIPNS